MERLFTFAYLTERTALDELALNETIGATSEPWPLVAQLVRRASFDLLAAYTERAQLEPTEHAPSSTPDDALHARRCSTPCSRRKLERGRALRLPLSLILFDVDRLSAINQEYGYGVGDKILERLGILIAQYFRQHDWVARYSEDSIVVLLSQHRRRRCERAGRARAAHGRRAAGVHRSPDRRAGAGDLSAAVINVQVAAGDVIDPERLLADAEAAVERAKQLGRNRVERVDGYSGVLRADDSAADSA